MPTDVLLENAPRRSREAGRGGDVNRCGAPEGRHGGDSADLARDPTRFGIWAFMGTVSMLFIGFTSAYIFRRASADWRPLSPPPLLWLNTLALLASSAALEVARRRLRGFWLDSFRAWVGATGLLGALFVLGQLAAWGQLAGQGVFLASNPHSSFFYLLTGAHIVHLLGGLVWFAVVLSRVRRMAYTPGEDGLGTFATYWHFLAGLWVYLLFLLFAL
jgi:cytochrome c oxidase subunit 3